MNFFLAATAVLGLILLANWLVVLGNGRYNQLFDRLLLVLNLGLFLTGAASFFLPPTLRAQFHFLADLPNEAVYNAILMGMSVWGMLTSFHPVRHWLARWLPLQAVSPVHTLALQFSGLFVGFALLTLSQGGLEGLAETAVSAPLVDFVVQQLMFVLLALLGIGIGIRRSLPKISQRLGLERPTWPQIRFGLRWILGLVVIQWLVGFIWAVTSPDQSELLEGINDVLLGNFDTLGEWIVVALGAGIGEELLFRGALQPVFGLWFTSILFALGHIQYGFTPITVLIFIISLILGHIRRKTNTTVAIFVHTGYDFVLGLFYLLAVYLEKFIN